MNDKYWQIYSIKWISLTFLWLIDVSSTNIIAWVENCFGGVVAFSAIEAGEVRNEDWSTHGMLGEMGVGFPTKLF